MLERSTVEIVVYDSIMHALNDCCEQFLTMRNSFFDMDKKSMEILFNLAAICLAITLLISRTDIKEIKETSSKKG